MKHRDHCGLYLSMSCDDEDGLPELLDRAIDQMFALQAATRADLAAATELAKRIERMLERLIELRLATPPAASLRARAGAP